MGSTLPRDVGKNKTLKNMDFKAVAMTALGVIIALIAYDMFIKKALKLDAYESYESLDE